MPIEICVATFVWMHAQQAIMCNRIIEVAYMGWPEQ